MKVAIIGLGYVGLPLSIQFARSCTTVLGIDIDPRKVELLNAGRSYIRHVSEAGIRELVEEGKFIPTTDFSRIKEVEAVIICVPLPLNKNREPDISYVLETGRSIAPYLQKGTLVVLESTPYPGTTDEDLRRVLEDGGPLVEDAETLKSDSSLNSQLSTLNSPSGRMVAGRDFHLAFSPEREDPGNDKSKVKSVPKVVGGYTPACLERAIALYSRAVDNLVPVSSCRVAEPRSCSRTFFAA